VYSQRFPEIREPRRARFAPIGEEHQDSLTRGIAELRRFRR
jgi:hypothetical protein